MPGAVERAVVRIAQEALANAVRHARPRDLTLTVAYEPGLDQLTRREREVLLLVAAGLGNDEVGGRLGMSPATMKTHVTGYRPSWARGTACSWLSLRTRPALSGPVGSPDP